MADSNDLQQVELQQTVERAVAQVLNRQLPQLQAELVRAVLAGLPSAGSRDSGGGSLNSGNLVQAVASVHAGTTQKEILRALLDAGAAYAARIALFVVKAGSASGWQGRGFSDDEAIVNFSLDLAGGPAAHAFQNRIASPANIAEMDNRFVTNFGGPENEQILVLPLVLKDKVAALLYADGGNSGLLDAISLELLVMATSTWLEVTSLRKQAYKESPDAPSGVAAASFGATAVAPPSVVRVPAPVQAEVQGQSPPSALETAGAAHDPFAAHAPKHIAPVVAPEPEPEPVVEVAEVVEVSAHAASAGAAASAPATAADPFSGMSPEDAETHRKAQRFARLLVDEIKLYNQAKVNEGRRNRDLYDRLKEDIEKSRSTYAKRYGATVAASGDYFQKEVIRNLAEEDTALMGANFRK
jgi:hypothetical protein